MGEGVDFDRLLTRDVPASVDPINADVAERPEDLVGRVVGSPEYQLTACVWLRGILAEHHGVPVGSVRYVTGGQESPGRVEKAALDLGGRARVDRIGPGQTLATMLAEGEIDAQIFQAETLLHGALLRVEAGDTSVLPELSVVKVQIARSVVAAVQTAVAALGNAALTRHHPLERHLRDVLCVRVHPPQEDTALAAAGLRVLGV